MPGSPRRQGPAAVGRDTHRNPVAGKGHDKRERSHRGNVAAGRVPVSTYRLQLTPEFGFAEASEVGEYLACLGVTHVYLSPVLETLNRQLWSVLRDGPGSPYATWFDIDWAAQDNRMVLPLLAGPLQDCLGDLAVDRDGGPDGEPVLRYFDHVLPLRQGTERLPLPGLLQSQHYRLTWWRNAGTELNWRRFFNITSLIAVRSDDPAVFDATHAVILRLVSDGLVDGLRVDHLDGLADPRGYLRRLASA